MNLSIKVKVKCLQSSIIVYSIDERKKGEIYG